MPKTETRFFFAFPRLILWWSGRNANRSEKSGLEANAVGALIHLVVYAFAFQFCLADQPLWQQLLWAIPLVVPVWLFWLAIIYANSLVIRFLRHCGFWSDLPQSRRQGILIGGMTTLFSLGLIQTRGWTNLVGGIWLIALILNLIAAALLAISRSDAR